MALPIRERIVSMVVRLLPPDADQALPDDVAQDTLLRLWTMRERLDAYSSVEALAMVIARNRAIDLLRETGMTTRLDTPGVERPDTALLPDAAMEMADTTAEIDSILATLPSQQQAVMRMRHTEGMEIEEIAAAIGSTPGAIRTMLCRARQSVKQMFMNRRQ